MINRTFCCLIAGLFIFYAANSIAATSPAGVWAYIKHKGDKPRVLIRITVSGNHIIGTVARLFNQPGENGLCVHCKGKRHDKHILGMKIIWGMNKIGNNKWGGGHILDPWAWQYLSLSRFLRAWWRQAVGSWLHRYPLAWQKCYLV